MIRTCLLTVAVLWAGTASAWDVDEAARLDGDLARARLSMGERNPFIRVALHAANARDGGSLDGLLELLRDRDLPREVRWSAAWRLTQVPGGHVAVGDILGLPESPRDADRVVDLLVSLGVAGVPALRRELVADSPSARFVLACRVVQRLGIAAAAAEPELRTLLKVADREQSAIACLDAVGIRPPSGMDRQKREVRRPRLPEVRPPAEEIARSRIESSVAEWCLRQVREPDGPEREIRFRQGYRDVADLFDRCALAAVSAKVNRDRDAVALLRRVLRDGRDGPLFRPDQRMAARRMAGFWLGELRVAEAAPDLVPLLDDPSSPVAIEALQKIGSAGVPHLKRAITPRIPLYQLGALVTVLQNAEDGVEHLSAELTELLWRPEARQPILRILTAQRETREKIASEMFVKLMNATEADERELLSETLDEVKASRDPRSKYLREFARKSPPPNAEQWRKAATGAHREQSEPYWLRQAVSGPEDEREAAWSQLEKMSEKELIVIMARELFPLALFGPPNRREARWQLLERLVKNNRDLAQPLSRELLRQALVGPADQRPVRWQQLERLAQGREQLTEFVSRELLPIALADPGRQYLPWRTIARFTSRVNSQSWFERTDVDTRTHARRELGVDLVPLRATDPETLSELADPNADIRAVAAGRFLRELPEVLTRLPVDRRRRLLGLIDDEREATRYAVAVTACQFPADEAVPALRKALGDGSARVRYMAAFALARHGAAAKPAIPELTKATQDEDETVRNRASETLRQLTDER